ncbi:PTS fructose transporter subunit IID [Pediococcus damnosus LMG 28219]|uniref:PTS system mannose/fructose/sorbose family transporter subunit IID n=1 Tax=Pediococcus damnosus TaxID=51663 RepID=UPI00061E0C38|nr:PTS system mannose/fructose/sorbose family transporter subunit IID [Pediococcus damnosus]AMV60968.1 PTS system, mannose-specific IID component [Pediococcus damnosus]AMV65328.1 PTS system, mannose-specific IID component [Pediococcus damnosus]AMV68825.1 PTS system, mannose-specific IID component [Pediococcus damnosus]KJU74931.1 PTS fructose transporter subunit IID [Pediococcus damnosus LMG 28219]PIO80611.1 PTS fructose transporter subunit IID [Pediococcus damnosus]
METKSKSTNKITYKLTAKDFRQINFRSLVFNQWGWNYERMQGSGYLYIMMPQLRKMYGDHTPELKSIMKMQNQFFNTSNFFNTIIQGIDLAIEEKEGVKSLETVAGIKAGLMGPFAAIGDSLFAALVPAIMGAIAANMAVNGNALGAFLWMAVDFVIMWFRWIQLKFAYKQGVNLVTSMQGQLSALTDAATLLGVYVVGALAATMVNTQVIYVAHLGKMAVNFQEQIDMIMPKLIPALIVGGIYWMLGKKHMTSTRAIFIVIIVAVALSALGILGKAV